MTTNKYSYVLRLGFGQYNNYVERETVLGWRHVGGWWWLYVQLGDARK